MDNAIVHVVVKSKNTFYIYQHQSIHKAVFIYQFISFSNTWFIGQQIVHLKALLNS